MNRPHFFLRRKSDCRCPRVTTPRISLLLSKSQRPQRNSDIMLCRREKNAFTSPIIPVLLAELPPCWRGSTMRWVKERTAARFIYTKQKEGIGTFLLQGRQSRRGQNVGHEIHQHGVMPCQLWQEGVNFAREALCTALSILCISEKS